MYKKKFNNENGFTLLVRHGESSLRMLEFGILSLESGQTYGFPALPDKETAFVILSGCCSVCAGKTSWSSVGKRRNVFGGPATAFFAFPNTPVNIQAQVKLSIAVSFAPSDKQGDPVLVNPQDIVIWNTGRFSWAREVHAIIDERIAASKLYIVEAFVQGWSAYPPHKHETEGIPDENLMEELYLFKYNLPQGFGAQFIYTEDGQINEVYKVEDNDIVEIPRGYHPYVTAPGYTGYMLCVMGGETRGFYMKIDPDHAWVKAMDGFIDKNLK